MRSFDDAFDELYGLAYRVAFRLLGDRADAEDAAQDALARAYNAWRRISERPEPWVARVVTNLALDELRRRKRRARHSVMDRPVAPSSTAASDVRLQLQVALTSLPRRQRDAVALRYLGDLSEADTAAALKCSVGAVKQHAHRGLVTLRGLVGPEVPADV